MVGIVAISKFIFVAAAIALSGCASMQASTADQSASVQSAVYVVGQDGTQVQQISTDKTAPGESKAMRFYWFLGGR
jgi:hypothetical protein